MWKKYQISDLFLIQNPVKKFNANSIKIYKTRVKDSYPYIVRSSFNNGQKGFIIEDKQYLNDGNTISFGQDTATVFYQPESYFTGDKIKILSFSYTGCVFTEEIACYLVSAIKKAFSNCHWGNFLFNEKTINNMLISLPTSDCITPDFNYMITVVTDLKKKYVSELEKSNNSLLELYLKAIGFNNYKLSESDKLILNLRPVFKKYRIQDLFSKVDAKAINKSTFNKDKDTSLVKSDEYCLPLTNAKYGNNGIMFWGRECDFKTAEMCISIIQNGAKSTGKVYPQPQKTSVLWDSYLIKLKDVDTSEQILLYLTTAIEIVLRKQFNYDHKATWDKVKNCTISLPTSDNTNPDYHYMDSYITALQKIIVKEKCDNNLMKIKQLKKIVFSDNNKYNSESTETRGDDATRYRSGQKDHDQGEMQKRAALHELL